MWQFGLWILLITLSLLRWCLLGEWAIHKVILIDKKISICFLLNKYSPLEGYLFGSLIFFRSHKLQFFSYCFETLHDLKWIGTLYLDQAGLEVSVFLCFSSAVVKGMCHCVRLNKNSWFVFPALNLKGETWYLRYEMICPPTREPREELR